jgi:Flp pilus assembly protein protease CpaA
MIRFGVSNGTLLLAAAALGAWFDQRDAKVPEWLTGLGVVLGLGMNFYLFGITGLIASTAGGVIAVLVYLPLWRLGVVKADDMRLMAVIGAIAGARNWLIIFSFVGLVGVPMAVLFAFSMRRSVYTGITKGQVVRELLRFLPPYAKADELSLRLHRMSQLRHGSLVIIGSALFLAWKAANT